MSTVVSLTSHGRRLCFVHEVLTDLIKLCKPRKIRIVLSVQEDEVGWLSQQSNDLIVRKDVELITVKKDYGPSTKQIPCLLKYPDAQIIVMDDDVLLKEEGLDALLKYRNDFPNAVLGFRMREIEIDGDKLKPFIGFIWSDVDKYSTPLLSGSKIKEPQLVDNCFFEHVGVVSYPPNYARLTESEWRALTDVVPYNDDVIMQVVNIRYGYDTVLIPGSGTRANIGVGNTIIGKLSLYAKSGNGKTTAAEMERFAADFINYVKRSKTTKK